MMAGAGKLGLALMLLAASPVARAAEFPDELVVPWFKAVGAACELANPAQAANYRAGFRALMAEHPEFTRAAQTLSKKEFPDLDARMQADIAKMSKERLLQECAGLLESAQEASKAKEASSKACRQKDE